VSDTPRTDKQVELHRFGPRPLKLDGPFADFARELERENAALRRLAAHRAVVIEHQMMTTSSYQITRFTDEDESIWDERVQRFMDADRAIINAARAEAFLRTIGKWEEAK
jgi:hypothetical protein